MRTARSSSCPGGLHQAPPRLGTPPEQAPPLEQAPPTLPDQALPRLGTHPPGAGTPPDQAPPTPPDQTHPRAGTPRTRHPPRGQNHRYL